MELNARVDVVGRDPKGNRIFRVITDGKLENALFLHEGEAALPKEPVEREEPPLVAPSTGNLAVAWIAWYKQKHGCSLKETKEAGMAKMLLQKESNS